MVPRLRIVQIIIAHSSELINSIRVAEYTKVRPSERTLIMWQLLNTGSLIPFQRLLYGDADAI